jgi:hypothetical protein
MAEAMEAHAAPSDVDRVHVLHRDLRSLLEEVLELVDEPHRVPRLPDVGRMQDDRLNVQGLAQLGRTPDLLERVGREDRPREEELWSVDGHDRKIVSLRKPLELVRRLRLRALRHHDLDALGAGGFHDLERPLHVQPPERTGGDGERGKSHVWTSPTRGAPTFRAGRFYPRMGEPLWEKELPSSETFTTLW